MKKIYKRIITVFMCLFLMTGCTGLSERNSNKTCKIYLKLKSTRNWNFSTYKIDVYFDGEKLGTMRNGSTFDYLVEKDPGTYELKVYSNKDHDINGKQTIKLKDDMTYTCDIDSHYYEIDIDNIEAKDSISKSIINKWEKPELNTIHINDVNLSVGETIYCTVVTDPKDIYVEKERAQIKDGIIASASIDHCVIKFQGKNVGTTTCEIKITDGRHNTITKKIFVHVKRTL